MLLSLKTCWLFTVALSLWLPQIADAQAERKAGDTAWYRDGRRLKSREKATGYRLPSVQTDSGYRTADYYINGRLKLLSYTSQPNRIADSGYYTSYDSFGRKTSEGCHDFGNLSGRWYYYYQGFLQQEGTFKHGDRSGLWRQYYAGSNSLYRKGSYFLGGSEGAFRTYYRNGKLKRLEYYDGGKLLKGGTCFDSLGHPVKYTPFIIDPVYSGDIHKFVDRLYKKGRRRGDLSCEYTWFRFTIRRDGSTGELESGSPDSTNEAYIKKIVSRMGAWKPMIVDGHPVTSLANCMFCVWCEGARIDIKFSPLEDITLQL